MKLTLEEALMRWSAVCADRRSFAAGFDAVLMPFLAGWTMRDMGAQQPTQQQLGTYCSSFRAGWREADSALQILARTSKHSFAAAKDGGCGTCGLAREARCHR